MRRAFKKFTGGISIDGRTTINLTIRYVNDETSITKDDDEMILLDLVTSEGVL